MARLLNHSFNRITGTRLKRSEHR